MTHNVISLLHCKTDAYCSSWSFELSQHRWFKSERAYTTYASHHRYNSWRSKSFNKSICWPQFHLCESLSLQNTPVWSSAGYHTVCFLSMVNRPSISWHKLSYFIYEENTHIYHSKYRQLFSQCRPLAFSNCNAAIVSFYINSSFFISVGPGVSRKALISREYNLHITACWPFRESFKYRIRLFTVC